MKTQKVYKSTSMIKNSTYIRSFTKQQKKQLEEVAQEQNLKTATDILFFALENYIEQKKDIERLNRIIQLKQKKVEKLQSYLENIQYTADKLHELSNIFKSIGL